MICPPCREAGEANVGNYFILATDLHSKCEQPETCSCQHKLGKVRNERGDG